MNKITTRALLVEDEEDAREILHIYMDAIFDEIIIASDGLQGLEIYEDLIKKNQIIDLIITDIKMPNKDGLSMIEEITKIDNHQKYIIVSAYKDEEYLLKSISLNIVSYFVKPLNIENIMKILKNFKKTLIEQKIKHPIVLLELNKTFSYNTKTRLLYSGKVLVKLSSKETMLMEALTTNLDEIKSKEFIKSIIWKNGRASDGAMRSIIKRVKDKINEDDFIVSQKGLGYYIG